MTHFSHPADAAAPLRKTLLSTLLGTAFAAACATSAGAAAVLPAHAADAAQSDKADVALTVSDPVVVTASRVAVPLSEAVSSISVVTDRTIEEVGAATFGETLQMLPNVQVESADTPIFTKIRIRGSDQNQITYLVDGVRQDNLGYSGNRPAGIFIAPELVKQVEVRNGGGSALYGNGGIGGTVAVTTKSAEDFLQPGEKFGVFAKSAWSSAEQGWTKSAFLFGRESALDVLVAVTRTDAKDAKYSDGRGRRKNETDIGHTALLAKVSAVPTDELLLSLTYNYDDFSSFWRTDGDPVNYAFEQHRVTGALEYADDGFWDLKGRLQWTGAEFKLDQTISARGGDQGNHDDFTSWSGSLQNTNRFEAFGAHAVTYGFDASRTEQTSTAYYPWQSTPIPDGSRPDSHGFDAGVFIQDEVAVTDTVTVMPVLRWSWFKREADLGNHPSLTGNRLTPGVTVSWAPVEGVSLWTSAVSGYRPPILDEVYFNQAAIPGLTDAVVHANPDLKPEKSMNYEVGATANLGGLLAEADRLALRGALFWDDVRDFVNVRRWTDDDHVDHYRAENVGHVVRKGLEVSADYQVDAWDVSLAYGLVHAENQETGRRVEGIAPQTVNARIARHVAPLDLDLWYRFRWEDASSVDRRRDSSYDAFATHAVGAVWAPRIPNFWDFTAGVAVENLTNEKFRYAGESRGYARAVRFWVSGRF